MCQGGGSTSRRLRIIHVSVHRAFADRREPIITHLYAVGVYRPPLLREQLLHETLHIAVQLLSVVLKSDGGVDHSRLDSHGSAVRLISVHLRCHRLSQL